MRYQDQQSTDSKNRITPANQQTGCQRSTSARGFTLIEVLIAMAIFAIGIMAVTTMQMRSINQNASARMQTEATTLAADWMERLLALPYDDPWLDEAASPYEIQSGPYTIRCTIEEDPAYLALNLPIKQIEIQVTNPNRNASKTSVVLTSIKGQGQFEEIE
ncbi:MAG: type IV pilus modification protein PilV [Desulfobacterales bacterium]|jgi:prepilin-type N-terminal cleavage/methylation domain-containing protein